MGKASNKPCQVSVSSRSVRSVTSMRASSRRSIRSTGPAGTGRARSSASIGSSGPAGTGRAGSSAAGGTVGSGPSSPGRAGPAAVSPSFAVSPVVHVRGQVGVPGPVLPVGGESGMVVVRALAVDDAVGRFEAQGPRSDRRVVGAGGVGVTRVVPGDRQLIGGAGLAGAGVDGLEAGGQVERRVLGPPGARERGAEGEVGAVRRRSRGSRGGRRPAPCRPGSGPRAGPGWRRRWRTAWRACLWRPGPGCRVTPDPGGFPTEIRSPTLDARSKGGSNPRSRVAAGAIARRTGVT